MRTWPVRIAAVVAVLAVSGCAVIDEVDRALSPPVTSAAPAGASSGDAAAAEAVPLPKRKPVVIDPKSLVGLDKAAVTDLFGAPHSITFAEPAMVWAWQLQGCRMKLFFYPDVAEKTFRALTWEVSGDGAPGSSALAETCPSRIRRAHADVPR